MRARGGGEGRASRLAGWLLATGCLLAGTAAVAEMPRESVAEFETQVRAMQALVAACGAAATACDAGKVAKDAGVGEPAKGGFAVHWEWLRAAMQEASGSRDGDAKGGRADGGQAKDSGQAKDGGGDRATLMRQAAVRLETMLAESGAGARTGEFAAARRTADRVLSEAEFQREVEGPTWWQRQEAKLYRWLGQIFEGVDRLGAAAPWLGTLLEWLFFGGAAAGLVVVLLRSVQRQRARVALSPGAAEVAVWEREAEDWSARAEAFAAEGAWRDAVHCVYWAAIVLLEGRRAWRHNPTRTPREYVRLLKPGSARQDALRGLTQVFERSWYGGQESSEAEYRQARAAYERLEGDEPRAQAAQGAAAEAV